MQGPGSLGIAILALFLFANGADALGYTGGPYSPPIDPLLAYMEGGTGAFLILFSLVCAIVCWYSGNSNMEFALLLLAAGLFVLRSWLASQFSDGLVTSLLYQAPALVSRIHGG